MCNVPIEIIEILKSWMSQWGETNLTKDRYVSRYYDAAKKFVEENPKP